MLKNVACPCQRNNPLCPLSVIPHFRSAHAHPNIGQHIEKEESSRHCLRRCGRPGEVTRRDKPGQEPRGKARWEYKTGTLLPCNSRADPISGILLRRNERTEQPGCHCRRLRKPNWNRLIAPLLLG